MPSRKLPLAGVHGRPGHFALRGRRVEPVPVPSRWWDPRRLAFRPRADARQVD